MLYSTVEMGRHALSPFNAAARSALTYFEGIQHSIGHETIFTRPAVASLKVYESLTRRYTKPKWHLPSTIIGEYQVPVTVKKVIDKPFGTLLHFRRDPEMLRQAGKTEPDPRVLIVAPMSGHFATLLRGTVQAMLPDHEVFITDWADARDVPVIFGRFDLNDYIDYLMEFIREMGPDAHTMAVCQPGPALLSAVAILSAQNDPATPSTMTFMGSPIDARRSPTVTNLLAEQRALEWFQQNMVQTVPAPYAGMGRRVYPGFLQLFSFMSMNAERHAEAVWEYFQNLIRGDDDSTAKHERFYDEYLSVCDMTSEFYLQTIEDVFQKYALARGEFYHRGEIVDTAAITKTGLLTVEGELDDISGIGQTQAAHDLCSSLKPKDKVDYIQEGAGHYGVFNGSRWRNIIQPKIAEFIRERFDPAKERKFLAEKYPLKDASSS